MAALILMCDEANIDPNTNQCTQIVWAQPPSLLPPLSVDDGITIGLSILVCWAIGWGFRAMKRAIGNR